MDTNETERDDTIECACCKETKPAAGASYDPAVDKHVCYDCVDRYGY